MPECRIERDSRTLRASNKDRRRTVRHGVNHRHQVRDCRKVLHFGAGLAKAPPIISDSLIVSADAIQLRAPHATIADAGVQKDDRVATAHNFHS
jgi:hypothetical protein